uniref:Immunoglobulin domain-containing protein n=1 Tax=Seriola dumerili TaxID=41447 RepID=A0A3B4VFN9_SERDU
MQLKSTIFTFSSFMTGITAVWQKSGENMILECSFTKCHRSNNKITGMYLYHNLVEKKEVLYYYHESEEIIPRKGYSGRVEKKGFLENNTVTIRNLTVDDSGVYTCVYDEVTCSVYILVVSVCEMPHSKNLRISSSVNICPKSQCLKTFYTECNFLTSVHTLRLYRHSTMIFHCQQVKQWSSRRKARNDPQGSSDYVYEVMTKNGLRPVAAPEQLSPSLNDYD